MKYRKIIFVCRDNSTLGPMAEAIYRSICGFEDVTILSRGLVVFFKTPINPKVEVTLSSHGIKDVKTRTEPLEDSDLDRSTLVLAMNERQKKLFHEKYPLFEISTLCEYVGEKEIEDPYGGTLMDYEKCFSEMSVVLRKLSDRIGEEK